MKKHHQKSDVRATPELSRAAIFDSDDGIAACRRKGGAGGGPVASRKPIARPRVPGKVRPSFLWESKACGKSAGEGRYAAQTTANGAGEDGRTAGRARFLDAIRETGLAHRKNDGRPEARSKWQKGVVTLARAVENADFPGNSGAEARGDMAREATP